jgi:hypothetical protein
MALRLIGLFIEMTETDKLPFDVVLLRALGDFATLPISTLLELRASESSEITLPRPLRDFLSENIISENNSKEYPSEFCEFHALLSEALEILPGLEATSLSLRTLDLLFGYLLEFLRSRSQS